MTPQDRVPQEGGPVKDTPADWDDEWPEDPAEDERGVEWDLTA